MHICSGCTLSFLTCELVSPVLDSSKEEPCMCVYIYVDIDIDICELMNGHPEVVTYVIFFFS